MSIIACKATRSNNPQVIRCMLEILISNSFSLQTKLNHFQGKTQISVTYENTQLSACVLSPAVLLNFIYKAQTLWFSPCARFRHAQLMWPAPCPTSSPAGISARKYPAR